MEGSSVHSPLMVREITAISAIKFLLTRVGCEWALIVDWTRCHRVILSDLCFHLLTHMTSHGITPPFLQSITWLNRKGPTVLQLYHLGKIIWKGGASPLWAAFSIVITHESSNSITRGKSSQESTPTVDRRPTCLTLLFPHYCGEWTIHSSFDGMAVVSTDPSKSPRSCPI